MKVRLKLENTAITATLDDHATSRDFVSLLPLTLTLTDYAETEKITDLPKRLSTGVRPPAVILRLGTSLTTRPGETWPSFTRITAMRAD